MICDGAEWAGPRLFAGGLSAARGHHLARAAFAAPGPLGTRHAMYKVRICRNGTAGRFWCIWGGERAGKSDLRGRIIYEDVFSPALELRVFCGASSKEGVGP